MKGEDRPTMKEVATKLEGLKMTEMHLWVNVDSNSEETKFFVRHQILTNIMLVIKVLMCTIV